MTHPNTDQNIFLKLAGGDGDVFLVAVANCIQHKGETLDDEIASPELVAKILLREKYEVSSI